MASSNSVASYSGSSVAERPLVFTCIVGFDCFSRFSNVGKVCAQEVGVLSLGG